MFENENQAGDFLEEGPELASPLHPELLKMLKVKEEELNLLCNGIKRERPEKTSTQGF